MHASAPVVETERLLLRPHTRADFEPSVAMWSDPAVVRYITGTPSTAQTTWFRLLRYAGLWPVLGYGYWAIEDKQTRTFIGEAGLADFRREIKPSIAGEPEIGWVLAAHAHGRGIATEAVRAVLAWADEHLPASRVVGIVSPDNRQSLRIALKNSFVQYAEAAMSGQPVVMFERARRHSYRAG